MFIEKHIYLLKHCIWAVETQVAINMNCGILRHKSFSDSPHEQSALHPLSLSPWLKHKYQRIQTTMHQHWIRIQSLKAIPFFWKSKIMLRRPVPT
jgi:hypothetical protein